MAATVESFTISATGRQRASNLSGVDTHGADVWKRDYIRSPPAAAGNQLVDLATINSAGDRL